MGGAEHSLLDIVSGIQSFHPVFVTPSTNLSSKFESRGIKCIYFPMPLKVLMRKREKLLSLSDIYNLPSLILRFVNLLKKEKPSLVYTNTQKSHLIGVIASRIARVPCISHFRDILPRSVLTKIWLRTLYLLSTRIIAVSEAVAKEFPRKSAKGSSASSGKVKVIHIGIKVKHPASSLQYPVSRTVGYVGQIARWKGVEYFIEACGSIMKEAPGTNFIVVGGPIFGDTEYLEELKELAHSLSLDSKIQFMGEKEDALSYIAKIDVLVHPSVSPEPFGRVLIEAASLGKPVVATSGGSSPEIVVDGETGILVPPRDSDSIATSLKKLIAEPRLAKSMGEKGKERVGKYFNFENMI